MGVVKCLKMEKVKIPKSEGGVSTGSHSTKKEEDIHQDTVSTNKVFSSLFWGGYSETSRDKELRGCSSIM